MSIYLWVALGSALGGMARYGCSTVAARLIPGAFPWGTLFVNVVGSGLIGLFAAFAGTDHWLGRETVAVFLMVGVCGGYTTFSAVSLQAVELTRAGHGARVAVYIVASVLLCLVATVLGFAIGGGLA